MNCDPSIYNFAPQGWQCPCCRRIYAPSMIMCPSCNSGNTGTSTPDTQPYKTVSQAEEDRR